MHRCVSVLEQQPPPAGGGVGSKCHGQLFYYSLLVLLTAPAAGPPAAYSGAPAAMNARKLSYLGCHPSSARVLSLFILRPMGPPAPLKFGIAPWYFPLSSTCGKETGVGDSAGLLGSAARSHTRSCARRPHQFHHVDPADRVVVGADVHLPLLPCRVAGREAR